MVAAFKCDLDLLSLIGINAPGKIWANVCVCKLLSLAWYMLKRHIYAEKEERKFEHHETREFEKGSLFGIVRREKAVT